MTTKKKNGFKIAVSGQASQIVLLCHGGWVEKDGHTKIPDNLRVCFYAGHGQFTLGSSVYKAVTEAGILAQGGLLKRITMSDDDITAYAGMLNKTVVETRAMKLKEATGVYDSFGGGNPMFNYALSRERKGDRLNWEKDLFDKHAKGQKHHDIDMMVMTTSSGRHLSNVFKIVKSMGYSTLHFGACRVSYGASPSEVSSV